MYGSLLFMYVVLSFSLVFLYVCLSFFRVLFRVFRYFVSYCVMSLFMSFGLYVVRYFFSSSIRVSFGRSFFS